MRIEIVSPMDAKELLAIYAPYVTDTAITFEYEVPSLEEFRQRIETTLKKYPYLKAVGDDGSILGYAYAGVFKGRVAYDWAVETSVYVRMDVKKQGIGGALYRELECRLKKMGIVNMNACITYPRVENPYLDRNSVDFHHHMGFTDVGIFHQVGYKFQIWFDMIWMEKMIGEHEFLQEAVRFGKY